MVVNTPVHQRQTATIAQLKARKIRQQREENSQMMFKLALEDVRLSFAMRTIEQRIRDLGDELTADQLGDLTDVIVNG